MATKTNVTVNGQEYFRIRRTVGYEIKDGKKTPIIKPFYGSSKGDAERKYKEYVNEEARKKFDKQMALDNSTLHQRAKEYIDNTLEVTQKYTAGTKKRYKSAYNVHIKNTWLDQMAVKEIHPSDIQRFYNELDVSVATLGQINRFMSALYRWMVRNEYALNTVACIELPQKKDTKKAEGIIVWDDDSWTTLTTAKFAFRHDFLIKLLCYSGMRIGECLGLKYGDIEGDVIHVVRQYTEGEIKEPKYGSKRDIPVHPKVKAALEDHKKWHKQEMKSNRYKTDYIFTTKTGGMVDVTNLATAFKRFYKRTGLPENTFHTYRRTFCTKLCQKEVPIEVASKLLGHKSLEVTAAFYALVKKETKADAIAKLD